ncbi:MAG TPA: MSMEG_1061 family FMN-dependent PPOX-type flavoprotein [Mycobacteriales bacterium]|nr:MSMEG_1061 family FMN-dependent PPOX-type flavoprotein [Mycobacteriales bacterium]
MVSDEWSVVDSESELREIVGEPIPRVAEKVRDRLHPMDVAFLAAARFWTVATSSADGRCDVSPKGDPAGSSVVVLSETSLALAERPGNRRVDGFQNLLSNPHVGLMFVVPGRGDTLRINGRARLVREAPFFDAMVVKGHRPRLALVVDVEEVFFHCSKAFLRSSLWEPDTWPADGEIPSRAEIAHALERPDEPLESLVEYYGPSYADGLYRG